MTEPSLFPAQVRWGVAIHGGVGTLSPKHMTPELERAYRDALSESLAAGHRVLSSGGSAVDAVVESVGVMEDSPLFNAGRGSNLDERGVATMDASLMSGKHGKAGAVAQVEGVRSPIRAARAVMDHSPHVLLVGQGAEAFARERGLAFEAPEYFHTERRQQDLERARIKAAAGAPARPNVLGDEPAEWSGTVGAVALDELGALAAATSTGGMANKTWGRVGDSPILGAGTWASPRCAISCTGWGELFIRQASARDVDARQEYLQESLEEAARTVVFDRLEAVQSGAGGLVAIDTSGRIFFPFSTRGMYRGWVGTSGSPEVAIYRE